MNSDNTNLNTHEQMGLLISRIADGEACQGDWDAFTSVAQRIPGAWQELATAQRDHAALSVAVGVALHAAERVELTAADGARRFIGAEEGVGGPVERVVVWSRVRTWGGWAAAAVLVLGYFSGGFRGLPNRGGPPVIGNVAGLQISTPDEAYNRYIELGQQSGVVLGEVPQHILIDSRQVPGGVECTFLRQAVEKRVYKDMVKYAAADEAGQARPVQYTPEPSPQAPQ